MKSLADATLCRTTTCPDKPISTIAAITFDLDGTLAEVRRRRLRLWRSAARHPGIVLGFQEVFEDLRLSRHCDLEAELVSRLVARTGRSPGQVVDVLDDTLGTRWPALFSGARVPEPVARLIRDVDARRLPRAVVSDHPALAKLAAMGSTGWTAVVSCRALGALKPWPDGLHAAAAQLGVLPGQILHVGDRDDTDGAMAAAAGAQFISVLDLEGGARPLH